MISVTHNDYWQPKKAEAGCYLIFNTVNRKAYIGSSKHLGWRIYQHVRSLRLCEHYNLHLQNAWNKYGESAFEFKVVARCDEALRFNVERALTESFDSIKRGYNKRHPDTLTMSEETRIRMSDANFGKPHPRKNSAIKFRHSKDSLALMSKRQTGENNGRCKLTDDQVEQMRELRRRGAKYSELANHFGISKGYVAFIILGWSRKIKTPQGYKALGPVVRQNKIALTGVHVAHLNHVNKIG